MQQQAQLNMRRMVRPTEVRRIAREGAHFNVIELAELVERDSKFTDDGKQTKLKIRTGAVDDNGDPVALYYEVNYTWHPKGNMYKLLEKLEMMPIPGEALDLDKMIGLPVQIIVENVIKDGVTYSNIVSMKRRQINQAPVAPVAQAEYPLRQPEYSVMESLQSTEPLNVDDLLNMLN